MLLDYSYWSYPSVISSEKCDEIVLWALKQKSQKAMTGSEREILKSKSKLDKKIY